jgi:hypothetical protein
VKISIKSKIHLAAKNLAGWSTSRKIVVFSVDDYGNIRIASKQAFENLRSAGVAVDSNRFDRFDALETSEDLTLLFETLSSVKDSQQRSAVFTAFALPANIDFESMANCGYTRYFFETLPSTFAKLPGYQNTWAMWKEGIEKGLLIPQYHGREHVNVEALMLLLHQRNPTILAYIKESSLGEFLIKKHKIVSFLAAFEFKGSNENEGLIEIAKNGQKVFNEVFGRPAKSFNAPGAPAHHVLEEALVQGGIRYIDVPFLKKEHQGNNKYSYQLNYWGKRNKVNQYYMLRNCVFEPSLNANYDWVDQCLAEIEFAFKFKKPANISSHRVNFCGHINPAIREHGLNELKKLLMAIVRKWPDVEFMSADQLGDLIASERSV